MPTALALSPHLDDAAFSCGGTLAQLASGGWRVVMVTLLTASVPDPTGFALACQLDKGLGPDVDYMALRRDEDRAAAAALGLHPPVHVALREAPHRGYASAPELFAETRPDDTLADDLGLLLARLMDEAVPDLLLAPQGVGGHVDHVQLVRALTALAPACPVLWWRDFPYTVRHPDPREPFRDAFAGLASLTVRLSPDEEAAKHAACAAYASQIGFQFGGPAGLAERLSAEGAREHFRLAGTLPDGLALG
ncbi:GlcNAc-PI de-N-acetylase [Methylobacterium variabile]|jgi:LmbE family N-acetylglucosaminyl deacetylase|uniref:GlcNAc-PI de-N-acetylase n=1 Tax=Methylobacterium variabile TaxID=298794 RepID=A0A0J6SZE8_9HYPH|nr:PIG-L family deacetylase [Methylobacterium variabile]KMO39099.1 GlcNAc-PI de-N-acetylase [Methylobacterium variabile]